MKHKILITTFFIMFCSVISKVLSFFVKIYLARTLSSASMNAYTLMMPTLIFLITLSQLGIPSSITHLCAKHPKPTYLLFIASMILLITNIILMIVYTLSIPMISKQLFQDSSYVLLLKSLILLIPFVSLSGLLKGYLQATQHYIASNIANIMEEVGRIIYLFWMFQDINQDDTFKIASIALFSIVIGEIVSSFYMILTLKITKEKYQNFMTHLKEVNKNDVCFLMNNSFWMSCSRFIGSITCFLEPILMFLLVSNHHDQLVYEYTSLNSFVLPLISMPSFLSITLANFLLPSFSYHYSRKEYKKAKKLAFFILFLTFFISIICCLVCYYYANDLMVLLYQQQRGIDILKKLCVPFILYALQPIFSSLLHALNLSKQATLDTLYGCIIRLIIIVFFTPIIYEQAITLALVSSMFITTIFHAIRLFYHSLFSK